MSLSHWTIAAALMHFGPMSPEALASYLRADPFEFGLICTAEVGRGTIMVIGRPPDERLALPKHPYRRAV